MSNVETLVMVNLEEYSNGYIATSNGIKGLFVSHSSFDRLVSAIPTAIQLLMKAKHGRDFVVKEKRDASAETRPLNIRTFCVRTAA